MSTRVKVLAFVAGAALPCLLAAAVHADETFTVTRIIDVPIDAANGDSGLKSFDIGFADPVLGKYYLADRSNAAIDVVDPATNSITQLTGCGTTSPCASPNGFVGNHGAAGPNGVITVDHETIWAADGDSSVKVLDLTGHHLQTISTGGTDRADELCVDPQHHVVLVANDNDSPPFITFISTETYGVLGKITMDGGSGPTHGPNATNGIEQCQWSPRTHKFYLNIPSVNGTPGVDDQPGAVLEINPESLKIQHTFVIPFDTHTPPQDCRGPQGMAIGPNREILLGCSNAGTASVIIDERDGSILKTLGTAGGQPGESGSDEVWYNPGDNQYFLANGNHKNGTASAPQLGVVDPNGNQDAPGSSAVGSHSVAVDLSSGQVYVPVNNRTNQGKGSGLCTTASATGHLSTEARGCIAVFTAQGQDDQGICVSSDDSPGHSGEHSDPIFIRSVCPSGHNDD